MLINVFKSGLKLFHIVSDANTKSGTSPILDPGAVGTVGTPQSMIPGLDDARRYFGKGGKGRLLIPAVLAYGDRANEMIPANSNLVFEIEVVDVTADAPKPAMDMAMPKK